MSTNADRTRFADTRAYLLAVFLLLFAVARPLTLSAQSDRQGSWRLYSDPSRDRIHLTFEDFDGRGGSGMTSNLNRSELRGLTLDQLRAAATPARFQLIRDGGTFNFHGTIRGGRGTGFFTFAPDSRFIQQLQTRGYSRPTADEQFQLALHNVGYALMDEIRAQRYPHPSLQDLVTMGMHGANLEYIRELSAAGYHVEDVHQLVTLRDHGVTASFAREFREIGYTGLSLRDLVRLRDHGVTAQYARRVRTVERRLASIDELIGRRDGGGSEPTAQSLNPFLTVMI